MASARVLVEAGADSVKLEGGLIAQVRAIIADGIPVMGHVGLLPQTAEVYRREGTTPHEADRIAGEARALDAAGCYAIVIEAVPAELATRITAEVACPTIGIAAGPRVRRPGAGLHRPRRPAARTRRASSSRGPTCSRSSSRPAQAFAADVRGAADTEARKAG